MNEYDSIEGSGLLKDAYPDQKLSDALKKKREKLAMTKLGLDVEENDQTGES